MDIKKIIILGLFKTLDYEIKLNENLNVIHGINGQGKTTILNIITNILNGEFKRFYHLSFKEIKIEYSEDDYLRIYRSNKDDKNIILFDYKYDGELFAEKDARNTNSIKAYQKRFRLRPLYLPAQRIALKELYVEDEMSYRRQRYLFERGAIERENVFVPTTKMLDVMSIPRNIVERVRKLSMTTSRLFANNDNKLFEEFFNRILINGVEEDFNKEDIINKIEKVKDEKLLYYGNYQNIFQQTRLLENIEKSILDIDKPSKEVNLFLDVYLDNIESKNKIIARYIQSYTNFEKIINTMFFGKSIKIDLNGSMKNIFKIITDAGEELKIEDLSSGEKNLLLIFYHYFFELEKNTLFMIDEPELSLHIDWQKYILEYFIQFSKDNQILVVTHSPDILQGYLDYEINLEKCRKNNE